MWFPFSAEQVREIYDLLKIKEPPPENFLNFNSDSGIEQLMLHRPQLYK